MTLVSKSFLVCTLAFAGVSKSIAGDFDFKAVPTAQICLNIASKFQNVRDFEIIAESTKKSPPFSFLVFADGKYKDDFGDFVDGTLSCQFTFLKSTQEYFIDSASFNGSENLIQFNGDQYHDIPVLGTIAGALFDNSDEGIGWAKQEQVLRVANLWLSAIKIKAGE